VGGLGIDVRQGERSQIIFKKSFVGFLEEGGVTPLGGGGGGKGENEGMEGG
jgi:hypothetical protein